MVIKDLKELSSFDVSFLVDEFQILKGAKIEKVFQDDKNKRLFLFQLYVPSKGKKMLYLDIPAIMFLTDYKPDFPTNPPGFCSFLRKKFQGGRIESIEQKDFERILILTISYRDVIYKLIFELFSKGNIVLCDNDYKILSPLEIQGFTDRFVRPGLTYEFPPSKKNIFSMSLEEFYLAIENSNKESFVKTLAIEFGFGGDYAEEILFRSDVKNDMMPSRVEIEKVYNTAQKLKSEKFYPSKIGNKIFPIEMKSKEKVLALEFETYNDFLNSEITGHIERMENFDEDKKKQEKVGKWQTIIDEQNKQILGFRKSHEENQAKGELIYSHYSEVKNILEQINLARKKMSWSEIKEKLNNPMIKKIDEHNGIITLELD